MSMLVLSAFALSLSAAPSEFIAIGTRLELMVDDYLIDSTAGGAELRLHPPVPREIVLVHDQPWEGNSCGYYTVFQDDGLYRMYYKCTSQTLKDEAPWPEVVAAYAESSDGVHWTKPNLGLFAFRGITENNIVWDGPGAHDFSPFKDTNPACPPEAQYKCVAMGDGGLLAFQSPDALHWSRMQETPVITQGAFDSQNLAFWDAVRGEYRVYFRDFQDGRRDIKTATSQDFVNWSDGTWLSYPGAPAEQLYTNQIIPYCRAPHIFLGFPTRYVERGWSPSMESLPELEHRRKRSEVSDREGMALTDGLFMSSRDAVTFHRWDEVYLRPGLRTANNWVYGDNYQNWGIVETDAVMEDAPRELTMYATESYWTGTSSAVRRFTTRVDGFASMHAPISGGEFTTKPLLFEGGQLVLNFSTSAAGAIRIEIQDAAGTPVPGFTLDDAPEVFGDALDRVAPWKEGSDLASLAGTPVRLRFVMRDADLYGFQFREL